MNKSIVSGPPSDIRAKARLRLEIRDGKTGALKRVQEDDNLITNNGMQSMAYAFLYAMIQNQNIGWGTPFSSSYSNLGNVFGAVGSGTSTPTTSDSALGFELYRVQITGAFFSANTITLSFFFPTSVANTTLYEAGVFINNIPASQESSLIQTTLTTALSLGTPYTSLATSAWGVTGAGLSTLPSGSNFILGYGTTTQQAYVSSAAVSNGATSVSVVSQNASQTWPVGTPVAFTSGQLFDHVLFTSPVAKNSNETATLLMNMAFTLT